MLAIEHNHVIVVLVGGSAVFLGLNVAKVTDVANFRSRSSVSRLEGVKVGSSRGAALSQIS